MGSRFVVCALAVCSLLVAAPTRAAEITRVASSFDQDNPFDLDFSIGFERTQRKGTIVREFHNGGQVKDVLEMRYTQIDQQMPMRLAIGLYHDLELHVGASMVFNRDAKWRLPSARDDDGNLKVTEANSTTRNNCVTTARGDAVAPNCNGGMTGTGDYAIFGIPGESYRAGFSDVNVGLSWAPFSDERDESKPKWVLNFDYTAPAAAANKPWIATDAGARGNVGDGAHRFSFATALSKRLGAIDPYVKIHYTFGLASGSSISNCDRPELLGYSENCNTGVWTKTETGLKPQHQGGFLFGAEFYPYDSPARSQRVSIDVQLGAIYNSEGRVVNELSDATRKLNYTEEYLTLGGSFGVYARAAKYVQLRLNASLYTDTEHLLTKEEIGRDVDGLCASKPGAGCIDLDNHNNELNPTFDFRYDMLGRRFRINEVAIFKVMATAQVNF